MLESERLLKKLKQLEEKRIILLERIHHARVTENQQLVNSWPKWKKDFTLTRYS